MNCALTILLVSLLSLPVIAQTQIDYELQSALKRFRVEALKPLPKESPSLIKLGETLFTDPIISGNKNISCMTCHHPNAGSADGHSLGIGEGGVGEGKERFQAIGHLTKRHSPHLVNLGHKENTFMFWDGRVSYNPRSKSLTTPEPAFNGTSPKAQKIVNILKTSSNISLAAQSLFPIADHKEMRGQKGENILANASTNLKAWENLMKRLTRSPSKYIDQFNEAYPETKTKDLNIGHVGKALSAFMSETFQSYNSPLDKYLRGDLQALTLSQKRGMRTFFGNGFCFPCHKGSHLTDFTFRSAGAPQLGAREDLNDKGLGAINNREGYDFMFKTPGLRNIALTAPYMHSGVFQTLEEVIDHYDNPRSSIENFEISEDLLRPYSSGLLIDRNQERNQKRFSRILPPPMRAGLGLRQQSKDELLDFLKNGLTDQDFVKRMDALSKKYSP